MSKALPVIVVLVVVVCVTVLAALGVIPGAEAERFLESALAGALGGGALHLTLKP